MVRLSKMMKQTKEASKNLEYFTEIWSNQPHLDIFGSQTPWWRTPSPEHSQSARPAGSPEMKTITNWNWTWTWPIDENAKFIYDLKIRNKAYWMIMNMTNCTYNTEPDRKSKKCSVYNLQQKNKAPTTNGFRASLTARRTKTARNESTIVLNRPNYT